MSRLSSAQAQGQPTVAGDGKTAGSATAFAAKAAPAALAAVLGLALLYGAGFSGMEALHSAAHDSRHSAGFPCH
jgi:cobalt transporter subunit CbtB